MTTSHKTLILLSLTGISFAWWQHSLWAGLFVVFLYRLITEE